MSGRSIEKSSNRREADGGALSRRDMIIERAEENFAKFGFQGGSLSAVARESGISNPALLHYFPSKESLYQAVLEKQAHDLSTHMDIAHGATKPTRERLRDFIRLQIDWMRMNPNGYKLITRELLDNPERIRSAHNRPLEAFLHASLALIDEAKTEGVIAPALSGVLVLSIILGALNYAKIVRPTLERAFDDRLLKDDDDWMGAMAEGVLQLVTSGGL